MSHYRANATSPNFLLRSEMSALVRPWKVAGEGVKPCFEPEATREAILHGCKIARNDPDWNCRVSTRLHPQICSMPAPVLDLRSLATNWVMSRSLGSEICGLDCGYRIDILIENRLILELKASGRNKRSPQSAVADLYEVNRNKYRTPDELQRSTINRGHSQI